MGLKGLCNNPEDEISTPAEGCPELWHACGAPVALLPGHSKRLLPELPAERLPHGRLIFHPLTRNIQTRAALPGCINHRSSSPFPAPRLAEVINQRLNFA